MLDQEQDDDGEMPGTSGTGNEAGTSGQAGGRQGEGTLRIFYFHVEWMPWRASEVRRESIFKKYSIHNLLTYFESLILILINGFFNVKSAFIGCEIPNSRHLATRSLLAIALIIDARCILSSSSFIS